MSNPKDNVEVDYVNSAVGAFPVVPSDTVEFDAPARALYVGTGGAVTVLMKSGETVAFNNVQDGSILPIVAYRVNATGTSATDIVGLK